MQISADYRNAKSKAGHHEGHEGHEGDRGKIKSEKPGTKDTQMALSYGRVDKRQRIHLSDLNGGCADAYPPYERRSLNGICGFFLTFPSCPSWLSAFDLSPFRA